MSIKRTILANYASQFYITVAGIVMVPFYLRWLGAEAYGLVGFFATLQAWFSLLDVGLTPTLARETARCRGGALDPLHYMRLVRSLEGIFLAAALAGGAALLIATDFIARDWLNAAQLPLPEIRRAVRAMALIVMLRWMSGLYRGIVTGSERLVWLGGFNSVVATLRFIGVLPVLAWVAATPSCYFGYQLLVAVLELAGLAWYAYRLLPARPPGQTIPWDWEPVRPVLGFALSIAFTSTLWVLVTQTDKLVLSRLLPLADYGHFTLAVLVAGGVAVVSGPIGTALLPRMTRLQAEGDTAGVVRLYRDATQLLCLVALPAALVLAAFAERVLWAWTGDAAAAAAAAPVLRLYALGNGLMVIHGLAYYLQFAQGDLRLHLAGTPLFLAVYLPALLWLVLHHGVRGAGMAWLGAMALSFLAWLPVVHRRVFTGRHLDWLLRDVVAVVACGLAAVAAGHQLLARGTGWPASRAATAAALGAVGLATVAAAALGSSLGRRTLRGLWRGMSGAAAP